MTSTKISSSQFVILLFISRAFNVVNFIPIFAKDVELTSLLYGNIFSFIIKLVLLIPAMILFKKKENANLLSLAFEKSKIFGRILTVLYLVVILINMIGAVFGFSFFVTNAIYPDASILFIVITMCLACFFCIRNGIEGIARTGSIIFVFFIIGMIFISLMSANLFDSLNIRPILENPTESILRSTNFLTSDSIELIILLLLFPHSKGKFHKSAITYLVAASVFIEVINFLLLGVLGDFAYDQMFPYFTLASLAETKIFQRLDSVHMVLWIFISFIKITLFAIVATELLRSLIPQKAHKTITPILFIATVCGALFLSTHPELLVNTRYNFPFAIVVLVSVVPLIFCFNKKKQIKGRD